MRARLTPRRNSRIMAEQTPGPVDLRTPLVAKVGKAKETCGAPLKVFVRVKPVPKDEVDAPCFAIAADQKTLTATAPEVCQRSLFFFF